MKKRLSLLLVVFVFLLVFFGCSQIGSTQKNTPQQPTSKNKAEQTQTSREEEITLDFWTLTGPTTVAAEKIIEDYKTVDPNVTVNLTSNKGPNHRQLMIVNASSGTLPEIWFMFGGTIGGYYVDNNKYYDLTDYAKENNWSEKFSKSVMNLVTYDGSVVGYPSTYTALEVFYRKDIFEKAGAKIPTTIAEFEEACEKIKAIGVTPLAVGGSTQANPMRVFQALLENYSGSEGHDALMNLNENWDSPSVVQALTKYKEWIEAGYLPNGFLSIDQSENQPMMFAGQCAMTIDGMNSLNSALNEEQDISLYGYFKFPQDNGKRISTYVEMNMFDPGLDDKTFEAAMDFIEYHYSKEVTEKYSTVVKQPLPYIDAKLPDKFIIAQPLINDLPQYGNFLIADQALPAPVTDGLYAAMDQVASGELTPEETARQMQTVVENYLSSLK